MNIGEAARACGLTAKMIRYYERIGLLGTVVRSEAGYRRYGSADVRTLRFIHAARQMGFSLPAVGELLSLWQDRRRHSAEVKQIARQHMDELDRRIAELQRMRAAIAELDRCCLGDARPECPILDALADGCAVACEQP